jgi:hypothetical protein
MAMPLTLDLFNEYHRTHYERPVIQVYNQYDEHSAESDLSRYRATLKAQGLDKFVRIRMFKREVRAGGARTTIRVIVRDLNPKTVKGA